ncbi:monocarboxylate transporter 12-like [Gigantopelta aegis]|uniref:monocarboxylate transporter 12-like n=1 Tax=Gigantopelta aegis TaxID=1735272 RepID=UPI001B8880BD|nr:monocarboxylate transporter 12-like [Gigantopelta aegis]
MKQVSTNQHAWVIVAASFFSLFLNAGLCYAAGVLHVRLVETYPQNVYSVAWLGSILVSLTALAGPVASLVINLYDCRTCAVLAGILGFIGFVGSYFAPNLPSLFVTYALIVGLGLGLSNTSSVVILGYYFKEDTSVAAGITVTGGGLGMFVYPVLTDFLLETYGLRGTFLILGGVVFQSCVCGMLMRPSEFEHSRREMFLSGQNRRQLVIHAISGGDYTQCCSILTNIPFLLLVFSYFTVSLATSSLYLYLPDYFVQRGASLQTASFSLSVSGIGSIVSRLTTGFAANDPRIGSILLLAGMTGLIGVLALFINLFSVTSAGQLSYGFLLGLYTGGLWVVSGPSALSLLGVERLATGFGLLMLSIGLGYLVGPPLAGLVFQASNQHSSLFLFCAAMCFTATVCTFLTAVAGSGSDKLVKDSMSQKQTDIDVDVVCNDVDASFHLENGFCVDVDKPHFVPEEEKLVLEKT